MSRILFPGEHGGAPLAGAAVGEFINWINDLSCGIDYVTQANYTVPA